MMTRIQILAALIVLAASSARAMAQEAGPFAEPATAVERLHEALVETALSHGDEPVDVRYRALEPVVTATHDLPYIAELTIRREWAGLDEDTRARFVEAFTRLSVMTYASRFAGLEPDRFKLDASEPLAGGRARVTATLETDQRAIPFEYVLHEAGGGWKIVNILADNVSDLAMKRAEYRRLLDGGTISDVIEELERQAAE